MNQKQAMLDTLTLAYDRNYDTVDFDVENVDYTHLKFMFNRAINGDEEFTEAKLGRWLGYMQGVLVANECITLDEAKEINRRNQ